MWRHKMFVLNFSQTKKNDVAVAGGKGANLGEMTSAGIPVPKGFVITADAYRNFIEENNLKSDFESALENAGNDETKLLEAAEHLRDSIKNASLPHRSAGNLSERDGN